MANPPIDVAKMNKEQLQRQTLLLLEEVDREREERNFYQLERDKIETCCRILEQQLEKSRIASRLAQTDLDYFNLQRQEELMLHKRRVKQIVHDYNEKLATQRANHALAERMLENGHREQICTVSKRVQEAEQAQYECKTAHMRKFHELKLGYLENMRQFCENLRRDMQDLERETEDRLQKFRNENNLRSKVEHAEMDEAQNEHVNRLVEKHKDNFSNMQEYYNSIIANNLSVIQELKQGSTAAS